MRQSRGCGARRGWIERELAPPLPPVLTCQQPPSPISRPVREYGANPEGAMPAIAVVDGIRIQMFYNDHHPAHFPAILADDEVLVAIRSLDVIRGSLPPSRLRRVLAWARDHQDASALNWVKCQEDEVPERI